MEDVQVKNMSPISMKYHSASHARAIKDGAEMTPTKGLNTPTTKTAETITINLNANAPNTSASAVKLKKRKNKSKGRKKGSALQMGRPPLAHYKHKVKLKSCLKKPSKSRKAEGITLRKVRKIAQ